MPTILGLIRGIAEYERLSHEVEATEPLLREHGFGPRRVFEAILAERDGRAVGFALYFFTFSTFTGRPTLYLEDLFVVPEERRGGIGSRRPLATPRAARAGATAPGRRRPPGFAALRGGRRQEPPRLAPPEPA